MKRLFYNALIVNEGRCYRGYILIEDRIIAKVSEGNPESNLLESFSPDEKIDLAGKILMPGVIDDQVHFRDPGLTHKGDIETESRCGVAGGVTSYMEMPNTKPPTITETALRDKFNRASEVSYSNYSFFPGATNDNLDFLKKLDSTEVPGIKVFLGSSTGNMLVDNEKILDAIFSLPMIIAIHSEDEEIINKNKSKYSELYPDGIPVNCHPLIRSDEACFVSTQKAVERAKRLNTRLHILHLSTAKELSLLSNGDLSKKRITSEVCVHHLWFSDKDYDRLGTRIKWNPAVKSINDRDSLLKSLNKGLIDIVATDHAPHLLEEKEGDALTAASGGPLLQHSLLAMLELAKRGLISYDKVIETMCHKPAELYGIENRGYLREGYFADIVIVDNKHCFKVTDTNILSKCGWSPFENEKFQHSIWQTYVNGTLVYDNRNASDETATGKFSTERPGMKLKFNHRDNTVEDNIEK